MTLIMATKLVVRDLEASERFYAALGLQVAGRNVGGAEGIRQEQIWLSAGGGQAEPVVILTRFLEHAPAPTPPFPGRAWLCLSVPDADAAMAAATAAGGQVMTEARNDTDFPVRVGIVTDPDGHHVELIAPRPGG